MRTFLLPLALHKVCGSPLNRVFLAKRDGIEPEEVYQQLTFSQKLRFPFRTLATLPTWLAAKSSANSRLVRQRYLAFDGRPKSISLPELDRLRQESVFASNAYPAARITLTAIPAMTTGRLVRAARPLDPDHLQLTFMDNRTSLWQKR